ncbi:hypothetical protein C2I18_28080 [Paenibacillus sp. PK3_47]|uniref:hypothetical protein n=1 Tax=Paenibacillus sp. PK3_47 TaxID=2072642 RepID=UPI00201E0E98|nr:hypothetical protein [Paenibacillus sp. PK3_47]UQZ37057.1 hypothetical protein C2I18_28080 [Paenibacillus sp. PK3_47]
MELAVEKLREWLSEQAGTTIVIKKQELEDLDTVHFTVESVDYRSAEDTIDDYLDDALILRGSGSTVNGDGEPVPLPQPSYEIAVQGLKINSAAEDRAEIQTDRGKYEISLT